MSFTGSEDHSIDLTTASSWTANYRGADSSGVKAHFFGKNAIQQILNQSGCVGIRIYYALDDNGDKQLILVGADSSENDLYNGYLAERSIVCPTHCGSSTSTSPLQS
jgi:hypothetical protein